MVSVLVLPLAIPVLIFGVSASYGAVADPARSCRPFSFLRADAVPGGDGTDRRGGGPASCRLGNHKAASLYVNCRRPRRLLWTSMAETAQMTERERRWELRQ